MTNFHDLKTRDLSPKENEVAVEMLAAWLYAYSETFDYDNATVADARIVAASIIAEAKELPEEPIFDKSGEYRAEGEGFSVYARQEMGRAKRPDARIQPLVVDYSLQAARPRISSRESEQRGRSFGFIAPEQVDTVPKRYDPGPLWEDDEPGEHSEVLAAIEAHNTGEE